MDFFGIGPWELILILVVALLVIGPGKIPELARTLGRTVRAIRKASAELTKAVSRELEEAEKADKAAEVEKSRKAALTSGEEAAGEDRAKKVTRQSGPTEQGGAARSP